MSPNALRLVSPPSVCADPRLRGSAVRTQGSPFVPGADAREANGEDAAPRDPGAGGLPGGLPALTPGAFLGTVRPVSRANPKNLILFPLVGAVVLYFGGYFGVEHLRHRKGSWEVDFFTTNQAPAIRITQPHLGISNVVIVLADEPLASDFTSSAMTFVDPRNTPYPAPFGRVIFEDLTFLPGTVTFDFNGHGVELIPRMLILNKRQLDWRSDQTLTLTAGEKSHPITPAEYKERTKALRKRAD